MKMYLISDNVDTLTGMRLAGVDGVVVHERDELKEVFCTVFGLCVFVILVVIVVISLDLSVDSFTS